MAKPTYAELEEAVFNTQKALRDAIKNSTQALKDACLRVDHIVSRMKEAEREEVRRERRKAADRVRKAATRKARSEAAVSGNGSLNGKAKRQDWVVDGGRIVDRYLKSMSPARRRPHDSFTDSLARLADLIYTELEREDGSLPPDIIQERIEEKGVSCQLDQIELIGKTHEWFNVDDGDIFIARLGAPD